MTLELGFYLAIAAGVLFGIIAAVQFFRSRSVRNSTQEDFEQVESEDFQPRITFISNRIGQDGKEVIQRESRESFAHRVREDKARAFKQLLIENLGLVATGFYVDFTCIETPSHSHVCEFYIDSITGGFLGRKHFTIVVNYDDPQNPKYKLNSYRGNTGMSCGADKTNALIQRAMEFVQLWGNEYRLST